MDWYPPHIPWPRLATRLRGHQGHSDTPDPVADDPPPDGSPPASKARLQTLRDRAPEHALEAWARRLDPTASPLGYDD